MSSRNMALDVLVRLRDNLSGGLGRLRGNLERLASVGRKIGLVGSAIAAISFMGPVQEAAAFQQQLLDIAMTTGLTGRAAFDYVEKSKIKFEELALKVGQTSDTIAKGAGQMIAAGVNEKLVDASIGVIGKAATAANAEFSDMAGVATSLLTTLKVPADQLEGSLAGLLQAGKEGAFEMKDMAKYFPTLTGQMAKFGVTGRDAVNYLGAALQIAKKGTADPADAANNLKNFLSKILAPATIKNFSKAGVDIEAVMRDAATKGLNPIEAVMKKITKITGVSGKEIEGLMGKAKKNGLQGAEALGYVKEQLEQIHGAGALGEIFGDMQVMDFLIPFLTNVDEFKRIKEEVAKATGALIDKDFDTQMEGINRQLVIFGDIGAQASREVGFAFGSWLPMINSGLTALLLGFRQLDASTGGMARKALSWAGGFVLLATAIGALGLILPIVTAGFGAIAAVAGAVLSPLGIIIGLLAGAGVMIWKNWDKVAPYLSRAWDGIKRGASKAWDAIKSTWSKAQPYLASVWDRISSAATTAFSRIDFNAIGASLSRFVSNFASGFAPSLSRIGESLRNAFGSLGETWSDLKRLGSAVSDLLGKLMSLAGFDGGSFGKTLGQIAGVGASVAAKAIEVLAWSISKIVKGLADLAEWANGGKMPDWVAWFPASAASLANNIADGVGRLWGLLQSEVLVPVLEWSGIKGNFQVVYDTVAGWLNSLMGLIDSVKSALGSVAGVYNSVKDSISSLGSYLPSWGDDPATKAAKDIGGLTAKFPPPANNNAAPAGSGKQAGIQPTSATQIAAIQPRQSVDVGGVVRVQVDGPAQVASVSSANSKVPVQADRGRMVGRA